MEIHELERLRDKLIELRSAADKPEGYHEISDVADELRELIENDDRTKARLLETLTNILIKLSDEAGRSTLNLKITDYIIWQSVH